jgi:hypothetical protein
VARLPHPRIGLGERVAQSRLDVLGVDTRNPEPSVSAISAAAATFARPSTGGAATRTLSDEP